MAHLMVTNERLPPEVKTEAFQEVFLGFKELLGISWVPLPERALLDDRLAFLEGEVLRARLLVGDLLRPRLGLTDLSLDLARFLVIFGETPSLATGDAFASFFCFAMRGMDDGGARSDLFLKKTSTGCLTGWAHDGSCWCEERGCRGQAKRRLVVVGGGRRGAWGHVWAGPPCRGIVWSEECGEPTLQQQEQGGPRDGAKERGQELAGNVRPRHGWTLPETIKFSPAGWQGPWGV